MIFRTLLGISLLVFSFTFLEGISKTHAVNPKIEVEKHTPIIGAIRWDAWFNGNEFERLLSPKKWHYRLPFYARVASDGSVAVRADNQEVMNKEISYAKEANLDYWAFCYYRSKNQEAMDRFNNGLKLYLTNKHKADINFCLILVSHEFLGPKEEWPQTVQQLITFFKEPTYQKVLNGRPLLFVFAANNLAKWAGSDEDAIEALEYLRRRAVTSGLREPYIVAQTFSAEDGAKVADKIGFDAISAYTTPENGENGERPFSALARANRNFWKYCWATGKQVIPIVNTGWDNRPRRDDPKHAKGLSGPWYTPPTPDELANHLKSAVLWVKSNPDSTRANAILIYAWNELDEGGWLVPTHSEGTARLDAISKVLRKR